MPKACAALALFAACAFATAMVHAQSPAPGGGKIYCWKNKAGKTECGDVVPYEYQDTGVRELNQRGVVIRQSQPTLTPDQKRIQQAESERKQTEQQRKDEQRRQDRALLDTFSSERDIDAKRAREAQLLEANIEMLLNSVKAATVRQADTRARVSEYARRSAVVPPAIQEDVARSDMEKGELEKQLALKRKEIADLNQRYDELKRRYGELRGASTPGTSAPRSGGNSAGTPTR